MATARAELITGERMDRDQFLRVWGRLPQLKSAELIDGTWAYTQPAPPAAEVART